jgi:hypothetical protein
VADQGSAEVDEQVLMRYSGEMLGREAQNVQIGFEKSRRDILEKLVGQVEEPRFEYWKFAQVEDLS